MLHIGIMTVPPRRELARRLKESILNSFVSCDMDYPERGPWFNWRNTAQQAVSRGATHVLVLQDDAILCRDFSANLASVLRCVVDEPLSLYLARPRLVTLAKQLGTNLLGMYGVPSALALLFPAWLVKQAIDWIDRHENTGLWSALDHDDARLNTWSSHTRRRIVHCCPSLVDHDVSVPSTLGHRMHAGTPAFLAGGNVTWGVVQESGLMLRRNSRTGFMDLKRDRG